METHLMEAMTSGVFVEVWDTDHRPAGQAVYLDWRGRPVPAVGDAMACPVTSPTTGRRQKVWGRVRERHFEVQIDDQGQPCVWVRLELERIPAPESRPRRWPRFSTN